jgi:hypothetical protein
VEGVTNALEDVVAERRLQIDAEDLGSDVWVKLANLEPGTGLHCNRHLSLLRSRTVG